MFSEELMEYFEKARIEKPALYKLFEKALDEGYAGAYVEAIKKMAHYNNGVFHEGLAYLISEGEIDNAAEIELVNERYNWD